MLNVPNQTGFNKNNDKDIGLLFEEFKGEPTNMNHLVEAEGGRSRGEVMEIGIVDAWNNKGTTTKKVAELLASQSPPIPADAPTKIVKSIKKIFKSGNADVLGAEQIDVSKEWKKFWPGGKVPSSTKTPKTDIKIGKSRISLKSGKSAQLMSGGKNESRATFYTAADKVNGLKKKTFNKVKKTIDNLSEASLTKGTLSQAIKSGQDEIVNVANNTHKELMKEMNLLFNQSREFKQEFAYEAMTGLVKFDNNDGTCDYFLCVDWEGDKIKLKICTDREYVNHVAEEMKVSVRFKSSSQKKVIDGKKQKTGNYKYWSVIGLIIDKLNEDFVDAPTDIQCLMNEDIEMMCEMDVGKIQTFIKDLWDKAIKEVKSYMDKAWGWIEESLRRLFIFLGIIPEVEGWSDEIEATELSKQIDFLGGGGDVVSLEI